MRNHFKIGSILSGGLDSGSVTALTVIKLKGQQKRIQAYTAII